MRLLTLISALLFATVAFAQEVIDPAAGMNFPESAITEIRQPDVPEAPENPESAVVPASPKSPPQPAGVVPEVWPSNTVPVFIFACSQGNIQLIQPCRCVITNLMQSMTHREFMELSSKNAVDKDIRYSNARQQCALKSTKPKKQ